MTAKYKYQSLENELSVMEDGSIEIELSDCGENWCAHSLSVADSLLVFNALNEVFNARPTIECVASSLRLLADNDRLRVIAEFCSGCGCDDPRCHCQNDD